MQLYFAYDGSLHGDWVSRYALRLASQSNDPTLHLIHVLDGAITTAALNEKFERLQTEAKKLHTRCEIRVEPTQSRSTLQTLLDCVPHSSDVLLICGTRIRQKRFGFLAGTVAQRLLQNAPFNVLALRVVQPGLLGQPGDFLIPVSGHPHGFDGGGPVLNLFAPGIRSRHVLHVIRRSPLIFRLLSAARGKNGKPIARRLAEELFDAYNKQGTAFTTRENTHKMAEANKAYAHFAW